jgi:hypothetical protein
LSPVKVLLTWDGANPIYGPDRWTLKADGNTLLHTDFAIAYPENGVINRTQYPQAYPYDLRGSEVRAGNINPAGTGASEEFTLGFVDPYGRSYDAIYKLAFTLPHTDESIKFDFIGDTAQPIFDESWGIDNVKVSTGKNLPPLPGVSVYADLDQDEQRDVDEPFSLTDAQGNYSLTLAPGTYQIRQEASPVNGSGLHTVTVNRNQTLQHIDFANFTGLGSNVAPQILSTPLSQGSVNTLFRYQAVVQDQNLDAIRYDLPLKPEGMVVDPDTGAVFWKPSSNQVGKQDVMLRVQDGRGGVDLQSFQIDVLPLNISPYFTTQPPAQIDASTNLASLPVKIAVGQTFSYEAAGRDPEGDAVIFNLVSVPPGTSGLETKIDRAQGLFTFTPTGNQIGINHFTLGVSDNRTGFAEQSFNIEVVSDPTALVNQDPTIASRPRTTTRPNTTYLYQLQATDPNGNKLAYSLPTSPDGMQIEKGLIVWTPTANQIGSHNVTVQVSDGQGGSATQSFTIDVTNQITNHAPVITSSPNLVTNLEREYQYIFTSTDPDGDAVLWSLDAALTGDKATLSHIG